MHDCDTERMLREREVLLTREHDAALDLAGFDARDTILDVATGSGRMLLQLVQRGYSVVSGDIDREALDRARERLGDLSGKPTLIIMDAHKLQFDDGSFTAATLANAIHEIKDPDGMLDEIVRVLTPNGKLLVTEFNAEGFRLMELHHRMLGRGEHPRGEMSTEAIDRNLRSSFDCVETQEFSLIRAWVASSKKRRREADEPLTASREGRANHGYTNQDL
jgi:ubiquinone/menaquinone biosynthesis C-methylase UbiE